jgi:hypothetical protein
MTDEAHLLSLIRQVGERVRKLMVDPKTTSIVAVCDSSSFNRAVLAAFRTTDGIFIAILGANGSMLLKNVPAAAIRYLSEDISSLEKVLEAILKLPDDKFTKDEYRPHL